jgi:hypothetical protein
MKYKQSYNMQSNLFGYKNIMAKTSNANDAMSVICSRISMLGVSGIGRDIDDNC